MSIGMTFAEKEHDDATNTEKDALFCTKPAYVTESIEIEMYVILRAPVQGRA